MNTLLSITSALCAILVESFSGNVTIKPRDAYQWTTPSKQQVLDRRDSIQVPKGAKLVILDDATGHAYTLHSIGTDNVNNSLAHAKAGAMTTLFSMAQQMKVNALGQYKPASNRPIYGGATRAEDDEQRNEAIACLLLATSKQNSSTIHGLELRTIEQNGLISFAIDNSSKDAYYVNVLAVNQSSGKTSLCVVPSPDIEADVLLLPPGQTLDLSMFQFVPRADIRYVLVATKEPYIPLEIEQLLKHPADLECNSKKMTYSLHIS